MRDFQKIEQYYNIKLDDTQKHVLSSLIDFCGNKENIICVSGHAGTGKTTIIKWFVELLSQKYAIAVCAPTNKALYVIKSKLEGISCEFATIHSFLALRPSFDILEFNANDIKFTRKDYYAYNPYDIVIIDESSMVNNDLFDLFEKISIKAHCKFIFVGDPAQLAPVNQKYISKVFNCKTLYLKTIYRQKEGCLYPLLNTLRTQSLRKFKEMSDEVSMIVIENNIQNMLNKYAYLFKFASDSKNLVLVKILTYTNNRISALNNYIRKCIYKDNAEYHYGEIITGYSTTKDFTNSQDYIITKVVPTTVHNLKGYNLTVESIDGEQKINVLSKDNNQEDFDKLACEIEEHRQRAIKDKNKKEWESFFALNDGINTPVDLIHNGRVIKKKSFDYGYCVSVHKSQASEYQNVLIDMENIWRCPDKVTLRQLQYVALSRTKGNIIIYQKDE